VERAARFQIVQPVVALQTPMALISMAALAAMSTNFSSELWPILADQISTTLK
jgi:hypothetical protein